MKRIPCTPLNNLKDYTVNRGKEETEYTVEKSKGLHGKTRLREKSDNLGLDYEHSNKPPLVPAYFPPSQLLK